MRVYGAGIKTYHVLCSKTYSISGNVLYSTASSRQAARSTHVCETRLIYQKCGNVNCVLAWLDKSLARSMRTSLIIRQSGRRRGDSVCRIRRIMA